MQYASRRSGENKVPYVNTAMLRSFSCWHFQLLAAFDGGCDVSRIHPSIDRPERCCSLIIIITAYSIHFLAWNLPLCSSCPEQCITNSRLYSYRAANDWMSVVIWRTGEEWSTSSGGRWDMPGWMDGWMDGWDASLEINKSAFTKCSLSLVTWVTSEAGPRRPLSTMNDFSERIKGGGWIGYRRRCTYIEKEWDRRAFCSPAVVNRISKTISSDRWAKSSPFAACP